MPTKKPRLSYDDPDTLKAYPVERPQPVQRPVQPRQSLPKQRSTGPEPICILKIELDGEHVEEIRVYEGDEPEFIVEDFGQQFNLSDNAKRRLL